MRYYLIRHKATGEYMPQAKKDRGYSHWNPSIPGNEFGATLGVPRLINTRRRAANCINGWAANPNAYNGFKSGPFGSDDYELQIKADGRKKEDLEIVEVEIIDCVKYSTQFGVDWGKNESNIS